MEIANGLASNITLTSLNLRYNNLRKAGERIAEIVQTHPHILHLVRA